MNNIDNPNFELTPEIIVKHYKRLKITFFGAIPFAAILYFVMPHIYGIRKGRSSLISDSDQQMIYLLTSAGLAVFLMLISGIALLVKRKQYLEAKDELLKDGKSTRK